MKKKERSPICLSVGCLPGDIYVSFEPFESGFTTRNPDFFENLSGRNLLIKMSEIFFSENDLRIFTQKNEKPRAYFGQREISVSFSHTNDGVAAAMSTTFNVGCDMESAGREVHPRLMDRLKNRDELENLYINLEPVRIWTLKEAALKMIGTGLRKPMNSVRIKQLNKNEFDVEFDNGKRAKICSFKHTDHWISVCYQELIQ